MKLKQFKKVEAVFSPKNLKTLKPEAIPFIGKTGYFQAGWVIEDFLDYSGQWAMTVLRDQETEFKEFPFVWIPEEDLLIQKSITS